MNVVCSCSLQFFIINVLSCTHCSFARCLIPGRLWSISEMYVSSQFIVTVSILLNFWLLNLKLHFFCIDVPVWEMPWMCLPSHSMEDKWSRIAFIADFQILCLISNYVTLIAVTFYTDWWPNVPTAAYIMPCLDWRCSLGVWHVYMQCS